MRAVLRWNPFIVQVRTAITLWVFDKRRVNGVRYHLLYRIGQHFAPCFLVERSIARQCRELIKQRLEATVLERRANQITIHLVDDQNR